MIPIGTFNVAGDPVAARLFSRKAQNDLAREGLEYAGWCWVAGPLARRFSRGYALGLGYHTSTRRSRTGATYDDRKRHYQGHDDPLVWTGRLRQQVFDQVRVEARATKGEGRGRITFGRLAVGRAGHYAAPPRVVIDTLLGGPGRTLPERELAVIARGFRDYVGPFLSGQSAPVKRLPPPPPAMSDRQTANALATAQRAQEARAARQSIADRGRLRAIRNRERWQGWSQSSGGSAPVLGPVQSAAERAANHRSASRRHYTSHRVAILWRRKLRRRGFSVRRGARPHL